jgi:hypothetical protein
MFVVFSARRLLQFFIFLLFCVVFIPSTLDENTNYGGELKRPFSMQRITLAVRCLRFQWDWANTTQTRTVHPSCLPNETAPTHTQHPNAHS